MQGYDSEMRDTEIEVGGRDQTFNMQAGRTLQKTLRTKESFIITNTFLDGTDGRKMSKSWGNAIWLNDKPEDMYAKLLAIKDELIVQYFTMATNFSLEDIKDLEKKLASKEEHPMNAKKKLAKTIVSDLCSLEEAKKAAENFEKTVQDREIPSDIPTITIDGKGSVADILVQTGLVLSKSDAKRLVDQGGVEIDNERIQDPNIPFETLTKNDQTLIQIGKRKFVKVKIENNS